MGHAPGPGPGRGVPTVVVTGFLGAGKSSLIRHWLSQRPQAERWAVLVNELGATRVEPLPAHAVEVFEVAGGCACCAADVAFRTTVNRLLRRGPWHRLVVEVGASGHPARVVDRLLGMPALAVQPSVAVVDGRRPAPFVDAGHPAHGQAVAQVELARRIVLRDGDALLAERLASLSPWPPRVLAAAASTAGPADDAAPLALDALNAPDEPDAPAEAWRWPAETVFDRRRLEQALAALQAPEGPLRAHGLLRMTGAFRTSRAWYRTDGGSLAETAWRTDSRFQAIAIRRFNPQVVTEVLESTIESRRFR
jgi:G3E family GTPase